MPLPLLLPLCACAFFAGMVDAVAGGGGLVQLPALFVFWPGTLPATVFGTNKLASICGTTFALRQYARHVRIPWRAVGTAAAIAFVFSFLGARAVTRLPAAHLRPAVLAALVLVTVYTLVRKDFGAIHAPRLSPGRQTLAALAMGSVIGFYDGFLGPGTGSFLVFGFVGLFGFDFLTASASAKLVNVATNLSALLYFAATRHVAYAIALPMAACNILGALVGARLAITRGNRFVRVLFLIVVTLVLLKFAADTLRPSHGPARPPAVKQAARFSGNEARAKSARRNDNGAIIYSDGDGGARENGAEREAARFGDGRGGADRLLLRRTLAGQVSTAADGAGR